MVGAPSRFDWSGPVRISALTVGHSFDSVERHAWPAADVGACPAPLAPLALCASGVVHSFASPDKASVIVPFGWRCDVRLSASSPVGVCHRSAWSSSLDPRPVCAVGIPPFVVTRGVPHQPSTCRPSSALTGVFSSVVAPSLWSRLVGVAQFTVAPVRLSVAPGWFPHDSESSPRAGGQFVAIPASSGSAFRSPPRLVFPPAGVVTAGQKPIAEIPSGIPAPLLFPCLSASSAARAVQLSTLSPSLGRLADVVGQKLAVRVSRHWSVNRWRITPPPRFKPALGPVGQVFTVGHAKPSVAAVIGTNGGRIKSSPFTIPPPLKQERGDVIEFFFKSGDVFEKEKPSSGCVGLFEDFREQVPVIVAAFTLSGNAVRLAWEAGCDAVHQATKCCTWEGFQISAPNRGRLQGLVFHTRSERGD